MKAIARVLVSLTFVFTMISCSPNSSDEAIVDETLIVTYDYNVNETELARLINEYRVSIGLNELEIINHISYKSGEHNDYMITNNVVDHAYFQERSENIIRVLGAVKVNENVAYNFVTAQSVLAAWLNSPGHKANIEGDFSHFGISVTESPQTGKKYYTNIFIKK
jgi:uncharacterized protein YkwD